MMGEGPIRGREERTRIPLRDDDGSPWGVVMDRSDLVKIAGGFLILILAVAFVAVVNPAASGFIWLFVGIDALLGFLVLFAILVRRAANGR